MVVALFATSAMAVTMPTLTPYPPFFDGTFTSTAGNLYVKDTTALGEYLTVIGTVAPPTGLGNNYMIQGKITMTAEGDVGFVARANTAGGTTYACSIDATNNYLNMIKVNQGANPQFVNLKVEDTGIDIQAGSAYRLVFRVNGTNLTADLFKSDGAFVKEITATDDGSLGGPAYTTGDVGTWALKKSSPIESTWANMTVGALPLAGDVNLDGKVNIADLTMLLNKYNKPIWVDPPLPLADFNSDGVVNVSDLTALLNNYNKIQPLVVGSAGGLTGSPVPEPSTICLVLSSLATLAFYGLRKR